MQPIPNPADKPESPSAPHCIPLHITIVILNWNGRQVTCECLDSLRKLTYKDFEVILVDNASKDGSQALIKSKYPWVTLIENATNFGFTGGNNVGMVAALKRDTDYLLLLNNDTVVEPDFLDELEAAARAHPQAGMLCPKMYFDTPDKIIYYAGGRVHPMRGVASHVGMGQRDVGQFDKMKRTHFISGAAMFIKREVIERTGMFDDHFFAYIEDVEWSYRALYKFGYEGIYVPRAILRHKVSVCAVKNMGSGFGKYLGTRNIMYFARKHLSPSRFVIFLFFFSCIRMPLHTIRYLVGRRFSELAGIWKGFFEFFRVSLGGTSPYGFPAGKRVVSTQG